MRRINLFAKGNVDVHDSLVVSAVGGAVRWNGINEVVRARFPGRTVRVRHETSALFHALISTDGTVPAELRGRSLDLGPYPLESQFSRRALATPCDAVVLSLLGEVMLSQVRHKRDGYLFYPHGCHGWPEADRRWLRDGFEQQGRLDADASMAHLARVCEAVRAAGTPHVLVYNTSAVVPGERIHCYQGWRAPCPRGSAASTWR